MVNNLGNKKYREFLAMTNSCGDFYLLTNQFRRTVMKVPSDNEKFYKFSNTFI